MLLDRLQIKATFALLDDCRLQAPDIQSPVCITLPQFFAVLGEF